MVVEVGDSCEEEIEDTFGVGGTVDDDTVQTDVQANAT